jgi:Flp pilus assembly protein TadG
MNRLLTLRREERGAATIEMAIALPTLIVFLWGIFQVGVAFQAKAGMQHALGEGARLATLC